MRKDGEGSMQIMFPFDDTLDSVARRFKHDCSSGSINVKTNAREGLFIALPLDTKLHKLRERSNLEGAGSFAEPFIVRVEGTGEAGRGRGGGHVKETAAR